MRANKSLSHHLFIAELLFKVIFLFCSSPEENPSPPLVPKRLKEGARQRLFRPDQLTMSMGIKFGNRGSAHTPTHSGAMQSHNTSFLRRKYKTTLTGALSALFRSCPLMSNCHAEMFTFTYKWPGVMLCHIMFHGQITCPISQSALQLLSPLVASIATTKNHDCRKKGEACVPAVKCHPELNQRDLEIISSSTALVCHWETLTNIKQRRKVVITLADIYLSVLRRSRLMRCCQ